jgi:hypothetical protein
MKIEDMWSNPIDELEDEEDTTTVTAPTAKDPHQTKPI